MYSSISIRGYRGLDSFKMQGLGRINLLVGKNNCGKTSILECIELLRSAGNPSVLGSIAARRGEWGYTTEGDVRTGPGSRRRYPDVSHLFANRELGATIHIEADGIPDLAAGDWNKKMSVRVEGPSVPVHYQQQAQFVEDDEERFFLHVDWSDLKGELPVPCTEGGLLLAHRLRIRGGSSRVVPFVKASGLTAENVIRAFSKIVLTPKHEFIKEAMRIIEPGLEDLATIADELTWTGRDSPGGVVLRLDRVPGRVPIGSMGDGMWRMLGLALSVADADGGVLLVDEIDTGLHYSVMEDMWRMLGKAAANWSVQVFATTHNDDCRKSLAAISKSAADGVTIQRIDRSRAEAVRLSPNAIVAAAERNIEVR